MGILPLFGTFGSGGGGGGGSTTLAGLTDVSVSSPISGQVLVYNGTAWVNGVVSVSTASLSGSFVTLDTTQTIVGRKTISITGDNALTINSPNINGYSELTWTLSGSPKFGQFVSDTIAGVTSPWLTAGNGKYWGLYGYDKASDLVTVDASGNMVVGVGDITSINTNQSGFQQLARSSIPSSPSISGVRTYIDNDVGFSRMRTVDETGATMTIKRDIYFICKNTTGSTISRGSAVYVNGADLASNKPTIDLAKADQQSTSNVIGLAFEDIQNGNFGRIMQNGRIENINTTALISGSGFYLSDSVAGAITSTQPNLLSSYTVRLGSCVISNVVGSLQLRVTTPIQNNNPNNIAYAYIFGGLL